MTANRGSEFFDLGKGYCHDEAGKVPRGFKKKLGKNKVRECQQKCVDIPTYCVAITASDSSEWCYLHGINKLTSQDTERLKDWAAFYPQSPGGDKVTKTVRVRHLSTSCAG